MSPTRITLPSPLKETSRRKVPSAAKSEYARWPMSANTTVPSGKTANAAGWRSSSGPSPGLPISRTNFPEGSTTTTRAPCRSKTYRRPWASKPTEAMSPNVSQASPSSAPTR